MKISPVLMMDSSLLTSYPSIAAWRAQMGSTSTTTTREPRAFMAWAHPLPTSPNPQMMTYLPAIITSVARIRPSGRECRHPYTLSNFYLVTQSLTLMHLRRSSPLRAIWSRRATPVVVSSDTPLRLLSMFLHFLVFPFSSSRLMILSTCCISRLLVLLGSGTDPFFSNSSSYFSPSCMRRVASPPSSIRMSGPAQSGQVSILSVHSQYSSMDSFFHAKTLADSALAMAAAA